MPVQRWPFALLYIPRSHPIGHAKTPHTRRDASRVLSFDSDVTFIAVGPRIIGLMPWRIIEIHGKKEDRSGPRRFGEVLSGVLVHA